MRYIGLGRANIPVTEETLRTDIVLLAEVYPQDHLTTKLSFVVGFSHRSWLYTLNSIASNGTPAQPPKVSGRDVITTPSNPSLQKVSSHEFNDSNFGPAAPAAAQCDHQIALQAGDRSRLEYGTIPSRAAEVMGSLHPAMGHPNLRLGLDVFELRVVP